MTDTPDWKPSEEMMRVAGDAIMDDESNEYLMAEQTRLALIAVRPLMRDEILAEEREKIAVEERAKALKELNQAIRDHNDGVRS